MKNIRRITGLWIAMVFMISILLSGCTAAPEVKQADSSAVQTGESTAAVKNDREIVLAAPRDLAPGPKDAYYTSSILQVWEPLVSMSEEGKPAPKLAKSWEMSADAKEWTFKLREDVSFHDGSKFDADAVIANFERYKKGPKSSPFYSLNIKTTFPGLKEAVKVDAYTFKLLFDSPVPTLVYNMTNFGSPMFGAKNFDEAGDFNGLPQGTGPFKLIEHKKDEFALLERNENYYGEKARTKRIRIKVIPDPDTRLAALKSEEIMGVLDLGAIPPVLAKELVKDSRFQTSQSKSTISHYFTPNGKIFPFNDLRMKQAISLRIDRQQIVQALYEGYGTPTTNILNHSSPFYKDIAIEHDPEKAKKLAGEVLNGKRVSFDFLLPSYALDRYPYKAQAELIQSWLKELGLDANIKVLDTAAFREAQSKGQFGAVLNTQGLSNGEPFTIFDWYMSSKGSSNLSYGMGYSNPQVDEIIAKLRAETNMDERVKYYNTLQEISAKDLPNLPLLNDVNLIAFNKKIKGYKAGIYGVTLPQAEWDEK